MKDKTILVTGATGKQGGAVARHLLKADFQVKVITRHKRSEKAQALQRQGAELIEADLTDKNSLEQAMQKVDGVFSVQNFWAEGGGFEGEIQQGKNLADVAKQAGVSHYVQSTMAEADSFYGVEHFQSKQAIEQYIDQIGLPRTFIGTVYFMDNLLDPQMGGAMSFPVLSGSLKRDTRFQMMAVDDIGGIVSTVFQQPDRFIGQRINVAGDCLTVSQMKA
ncbi:MAG: NmrA/HSCARG family protein, partial [Chloroflexota bacterium]